jgi:suppressor for copper-sensitivity B
MAKQAPGGSIGRWAMALAFVLTGLAPGPARAEEGGASPWFSTPQGSVRLIAASPAVGDSAHIELGLDFRLAPHWKIYWRTPGDAGYPPRLDWTGSTNLASAAMAWPAPQRFSSQGLETIGYLDRVVFPISARLDHPGAAAHLRLALSYLTCNEICIPYDTVLPLDLRAGTAPGGYAALIARYAQRVPGRGGAAGFSLDDATIVSGKQAVLELRVKSATPLLAPDAFIEGPRGLVFGLPQRQPGQGMSEFVLRLPVFGDRAEIDRLPGETLTVTLIDGDRALEARIAPSAAPASADLSLLLTILPLALLGGFILNFMPCVLPVLSIKLLSVIEQGGRSRAASRLGFLASAAGVVLSFLLLAAAMVALKSAGIAVGWGVQFQRPSFLVGMVAVLTVFACNLWGFFEVLLPHRLAALAGTGEGHRLLGNIATGAFATLLATPCSAPFLGTAIGFALAGGPVEIFAVFLALGLGLAAPYLLVAAFPRLVRGLPRPGPWMLTLRRVLGWALAATAVWLVSVLAAQTGAAAALVVAALMIALVAVLRLPRAALARRVVPPAVLLAAFLVPAVAPVPPAAIAREGAWRGFDEGEIARLVGEGRVVFVDVTADWCLTCKLNKELVIDAPRVAARLGAPGVVTMQADWTRPNAAIAAYLHRFGRYGIPFNAVYGPGAPAGFALSEILSVERVLAALDRAAGPGPIAGTER